ncbi:mandelate racemase/muconate lactonizing enzyme family protein [Elioraea sp. Yellowstone]|uniref:mandelate racemase/muconate lactonizing enzyme family protein n=1 Tax=Elioraea sp. Yellowstone TaxID=2592070 RepID=UPI00114F6C14|nr:mandelate racemase/muconate lactonizing enzyme family protein [Elioraea sp. Yellowstone]TQF84460.1 mandelate racemase/muconate lactonizing enzyme family protein [Elioraea sp. Yellowstone]
MRIAAIRFAGVNVTPKTNWSFVQVATEDRRTGTGECTLANHEAVLALEVARLDAALRGADARDRNALARLLPHAPGGLVRHAAISALEQALWDLAGQEAGVPIWRLLGGRLRDRVALYANINRGVAERVPEGFAAAARRAVADGFGAVKLAPFDPFVWEDAAAPDQRAAYARGIERIAAVREAVGPGIDVMVDCHWRFSAGGAAALVRDLARFDLFWLECPLAEANLGELRRIRAMANDRGMRLAGAETLAGLAGFAPVIAAGAYDVLMPDIKYCGGYEEMRRIAALAQVHGIEIAPHNPTGPICHAHTVHACATIPNLGRLEVQFGETPLFFGIAAGTVPAISGGAAPVPDRPGLGAALAEGIAAERPWIPIPSPWLDPRLG